MTVALTRSQIVMHRQDEPIIYIPPNSDEIEIIEFLSREDDNDTIERQVCILHRDWADMGSPDVVTVTVEPGDRLNP